MSRAIDLDWVGCHTCGTVHNAQTPHCRTCGAGLHSRKPASLQRAWAWLTTGVLFLIPANLLPLLSDRTLGSAKGHTILEGIVLFLQDGDYLVAIVILLASFIIPFFKIGVIALLVLSIQFRWPLNKHTRLLLHEFVEFIGRWSMIDVFVVSLLTGLVHLGTLLVIIPGIGAICFATAVICTMFSAQSIDSKLIWDGRSNDE